MSKIKALITTFVLASSSVAIAAPTTSFTASAQWGTSPAAGPQLRDQRNRARPWVALGAPVRASRQNIIRVTDQRDNFTQLRVQRTAGATYIYSLTVHFDDGSRQVLTANKWLYAGMTSMELALPTNRRGIDRIVVSSYAGQGATFQVFGQRARVAQLPPPRPPVYQPPIYQPPVHQAPIAQPVLVGRDLSFANTSGSRSIVVGAARGTFGTLRVHAHGLVPLASIQVVFANGTTQMFNDLSRLRSGETIDLKLSGMRAVRQITLTTQGRRPGSAQGTLDVSLL